MSGRVGPVVEGVVLARIGDHDPYDPELERHKAEERWKKAEQAEVERQKTCAQLLNDKSTGWWKSFRLWWNSCPQPAVAKTEPAKPAKQPRQATPGFMEVKFSGR